MCKHNYDVVDGSDTDTDADEDDDWDHDFGGCRDGVGEEAYEIL